MQSPNANTATRRRFLGCAITLLAGNPLVVSRRLLSQERAATPSSGLSDEAIEQFLLNAEVVRRRGIPVGITQPDRLTLSDGQMTHDAQFQDVDVRKPVFTTPRGTEIDFRDYHGYNVAAYRLDRLLNLNMVPVSVQRRIGGRAGAVTWWIDDVQMMERERYTKQIQPPDVTRWNDQMHQVRVFCELVCNADPNLTNLLITNDWDLRMIDFTRAFRRQTTLADPKNLSRIDRRVYEGLRNLNEEVVTRELGPYLNKPEIAGLLARRELILKFVDERIAQLGEAAVICDEPGH